MDINTMMSFSKSPRQQQKGHQDQQHLFFQLMAKLCTKKENSLVFLQPIIIPAVAQRHFWCWRAVHHLSAGPFLVITARARALTAGGRTFSKKTWKTR